MNLSEIEQYQVAWYVSGLLSDIKEHLQLKLIGYFNEAIATNCERTTVQ